ncbi:hypothetical protein H0G86_002801 [Trichoderma simmonsii]|uniref:Uncharacterized protein n=1 Tax=Trichoderma simmonsii TaxID=1491479 RepID=A0A8G0L8Z0_9HYPO|nr:hypothetical protein H0G86_002801 [Trichoderma simmonsii]
MQFKSLALMTALLSISQAQTAMVPDVPTDVPTDGISGIKNITELSSDLLGVVGGLNESQATSDFTIIVDDLKDIIADIGKEVAALSIPSAITDQQGLCDSFSGFVNVTQELFGVFSEKEPILSTVNATDAGNFTNILRTLTIGVFGLGSKIITLAPGCADVATKELGDFIGAANQTIGSFHFGG